MSFALGIVVLGGLYWRRGLLRPQHLLMAAVVVGMGLALIVLVYPQAVLRLTDPDGRSVESRMLLTDQALMIIRSHPWQGIGYAAYNWVMFDYIPPSWALVQPDMHAGLRTIVVHNHYLLLAAELGLPAMLCFVGLLVWFLRPLWPLRRWQDPGLAGLGLGLGAALVAHALYLSSDNYYTDIRVLELWVAAALLRALARFQPVPPREAHA